MSFLVYCIGPKADRHTRRDLARYERLPGGEWVRTLIDMGRLDAERSHDEFLGNGHDWTNVTGHIDDNRRLGCGCGLKRNVTSAMFAVFDTLQDAGLTEIDAWRLDSLL